MRWVRERDKRHREVNATGNPKRELGTYASLQSYVRCLWKT